ncbi:hypothetical protein [Nocardia aurea]|uniref:hypothetical protein n=1 Tax=Nocardia aurea TaxID=2144174 RepID=UPI0033A4268E
MNNDNPPTPNPFKSGDRVRVRQTGEFGTVDEIVDGEVIIEIDGLAPGGWGFPAAELQAAVENCTELSMAQSFNRRARRSADRKTERCAGFCDRKEIHAADPNYDDGSCWSADQSVALNVEKYVMGLPKLFDIGAFREAENTESVVSLTTRSSGHYQGVDFKITADEARRIAAHLLHAADLVERELNGGSNR